MITLSAFLLLSLCMNIVLIWYSRKLTKQFLFFSENIEGLEGALTSFDEHLKGVHELEMFYGDDTLGSLIEHSRAIVGTIQEFSDSFILEEEEEDVDGSS